VVAIRAEQGGGLAHYWLNNDDPSYAGGRTWQFAGQFGTQAGLFDAVSLLQDSRTQELKVVARGSESNSLGLFTRQGGPHGNWQGPEWFFDGASGVPGIAELWSPLVPDPVD
jgi:hypothetical protein